MAGTAISEMIFFIAAILISSSIALVFIGIADDYSSGVKDTSDMLRSEMRSRMTIINDPGMVPYDTSASNLTFYLKNTGTGDLSLEDIVVSANGTALSGSSIRKVILDDGTRWAPGDVVEVTFKVTGLKEGTDIYGWASTSGLNDQGVARGSTQDTILFRIKGV